MGRPSPHPDNLTDLAFPETLTLWSLRYACDDQDRTCDPGPEQDEAAGILWRLHGLARCPEAYRHLCLFLPLLARDLCRPVHINRPACPEIAWDEWRLLQALGFCQLDHQPDPAPLLSPFLPPAEIEKARPVLRNWALALALSGYEIPVRPSVLFHLKKAVAGSTVTAPPASQSSRPVDGTSQAPLPILH
ncbi:hypothetical protein [Sneathiella chinensis]|uniref:Nitrogen fixation protein NifQ n=1 Tax=Sneathiella chinensis TaxID=349750 RepID=A0ABQ5U465_9PROT|nr:hypothetical protein [Sneathiella chinensis]GLQ06934.1 hypothetical protein GCM10007924_21550 [Sneathiella chinensis]